MIGKTFEGGLRIADYGLPERSALSKMQRLPDAERFSNPRSAFHVSRFAKGFTLLELLIVMSIIIILATIALPQYQRMVLHAKETVLRDDLYQMRKALDQYASDKGKLPQSLDDLKGLYIREVPLDPFTDQPDWQQISGEDPNNKEGGSGIVDVKSSAPGADSDGRAYSDY